ncbi:MAG: C-GCAxxG-C-C family protein [Planctomycetes bacterium]|nr:C-GCAxxG-C-C family protein [Planctomycetota bacterium]
MTERLTRKELLTRSAKCAAGIVAGGAAIDVLLRNKSIGAPAAPAWPWPYQALDVEKVRILGHDLYYDSANGGGCGYGAFGAILQALKDAVGDPYTTLPPQLMYFALGGAASWGTLCGALNGASAAISLVCDKASCTKLVSELIGWYTQTKLPSALSNECAVNNAYGVNKVSETLAQNVSGSPLCHVSVSLWSEAAGVATNDPKRAERCARLVGDTVAYAVQILNDHFSAKFVAGYVPPADVAICESCHTPTATNPPSTNGKMECVQCHEAPHRENLATPTGN